MKDRCNWHYVILAISVLIGLVATATTWEVASSVQAISKTSVWGTKPVLSYFVLTPELADILREDLEFSPHTLDQLRDIARQEILSLQELHITSNNTIKASDIQPGAAQAQEEAQRYNSQVAQIIQASETRLRKLLSDREFQRLITWIETHWAIEQYRHSQVATAGARTYTVFATQYAAHTGYEIALPDKCLKFANRGWSLGGCPSGYAYGENYSVKLVRGNYTIDSVHIWDVGPWNEDDGYWATTDDPQPRRRFTDLPLGMPEAQAAYFDNYNGGKDQFGRIVSNPAGIDLSDEVRQDLGLGYLQNAWIEVTYLWTTNWNPDETPPTINFTTPDQNQWYNTDQTLSWSITDDDSGVDYYKWAWNTTPPDTRVNSSSGSTQLSVVGQGRHTLYVQAWDKAGNDVLESRGWFGYDTVAPNAPIINSGCLASHNQWQNTCRAPNFSWTTTDPNGSAGSGVGEYAYLWGASNTGDPADWDTATRYDPPPIADADDWAQYYLHVKAKDRAGNISHVSTFGLWYDGVPPTATIAINNGAATTYQTSVQVHLSAEDVGSGVADVRLSHNGFAWADWQPYADVVAWGLPALNRREIPVYAQVRDRAGNLSAVVSDTIMLDLYPVAPHSAGFRICADVINSGGSVGLTSTGFSLISAIGQPWQTGPLTSTSRQGASGFLADLHSCRPITHTVTADLNLHSWVIASGGNLRSSTGFRLGDTAGQPAASETNAFRSANYILSSGFWGNVSTPACPAPLTGVRVTGPATGTVNTALTFTAHLTPTEATEPLTITWTPTPQSGQGTAQAVYQWPTADARTVTATVENCGGSFSASHTVDIQEPPAPVCPAPLTGLRVTGPVTGIVGTLLNFEVAITPADATRPIAFTWTPTPESGQGTTQAAYRYTTAGEKTVTVTAAHCDGAVTASDTTTVSVLLAPPLGFGVSINDGARYTNDPNVTMRTWAPEDISEMRLSNDGAYSNDDWQTYQESMAWELEPYGDHLLPYTVYVWFKDAQNQVYGAHTDDIIYDPVPPTGSVSILSLDGNQVTLSLTATDDNSGVAEMRLAASESAILPQAWQPFAESVTLTLSGDVAYVQFRDHAGNLSAIYGSDGSTSADQQYIYLPLVIRNH